MLFEQNALEVLSKIPYSSVHNGVVSPTALAVDFDGTLAKDMWPGIGEPNDFLIKFLIHFRQMGGQVVLWTCRTNEKLQDAVSFCAKNGLFFDAINENLPTWKEFFGNDSRKIGADYYIDNRSIFIEV